MLLRWTFKAQSNSQLYHNWRCSKKDKKSKVRWENYNKGLEIITELRNGLMHKNLYCPHSSENKFFLHLFSYISNLKMRVHIKKTYTMQCSGLQLPTLSFSFNYPTNSVLQCTHAPHAVAGRAE